MQIVEQGRIARQACNIGVQARVQNGHAEAQREQGEHDDEEGGHQAERYYAEEEGSYAKYQEAAAAEFFDEEPTVEGSDQIAERGGEKEQSDGSFIDTVVGLDTWDEDTDGSVV
jgi:hypothetical protein